MALLKPIHLCPLPAVLVTACVLALLPHLSGAPAPAPRREYQVKAVFLLNFTRFVEWPPHMLPSPDAPFVIGVLGEDPFGHYLDDTVRHEHINQHPIVVRRYRTLEELGDCHLLFISRSESGQLEEILRRVKGRDVLTVSDAPQFAASGGMIGFVNRDDKVRLQINLEVAKHSELAISSKLLRPSEIIGNWHKELLPWFERQPSPWRHVSLDETPMQLVWSVTHAPRRAM